MPQLSRVRARKASRACLLAALILLVLYTTWALMSDPVSIGATVLVDTAQFHDDGCQGIQPLQVDAAAVNAQYHCVRATYARSFPSRHTETGLFFSEKQRQGERLHVVFTVDCTFHSLWQALTLELSWLRVRQPGFLTRIVTGCTNGTHFNDKGRFLAQSIITQRLSHHRSRFGVYFVGGGPTSSVDPTYAPSNRPSAVHQFLSDDEKGKVLNEVMIVLDPDMIFLKPLVPPLTVRRGLGAAQEYRYLRGRPFDSYDCGVCPGRQRFTSLGGKDRFNVGPPWILHRDDLFAISATWTVAITQLRQRDDASWVIDMDAYAVSAAFHNVSHVLLLGTAVDSADNEVAWRANAIAPQTSLLHYCFAWEVGDMSDASEGSGWRHLERLRGDSVQDRFYWSKYAVPSDWPHGSTLHPLNVLTCESPLLQEPYTLEKIWYSKEYLRRNRGTRLFAALPNVTQFPRAFFAVREIVTSVNTALSLWKSRVLRCCLPHECSSGSKSVINVSRALRLSPAGIWVSQYPTL